MRTALLKHTYDPELLDEAKLASYLEGTIDIETLVQLKQNFASDASEIIRRLQEHDSLEPPSHSQLLADTHALTGIAGNICASRLESTARQIEDELNAPCAERSSVSLLIQHLPLQLRETLFALENFLNQR